MIYVFPRCQEHEKEISQIKNISRLYAFPTVPKFDNNSKITILDSGAFMLSQQNKKIGKKYMEKLSEHYSNYAKNNSSVFCVAPDVLEDATTTMFNFLYWHKMGLYENIAPVIQLKSTNRNSFNSDEIKKQIDFYAKHSKSKTIMFPTNFYAKDVETLNIYKLFDYCKECGFNWLHCLGQGWDLDDVKKWAEFESVDSIDSIAYYTSIHNFTKKENATVIDSINAILEVLK